MGFCEEETPAYGPGCIQAAFQQAPLWGRSGPSWTQAPGAAQSRSSRPPPGAVLTRAHCAQAVVGSVPAATVTDSIPMHPARSQRLCTHVHTFPTTTLLRGRAESSAHFTDDQDGGTESSINLPGITQLGCGRGSVQMEPQGLASPAFCVLHPLQKV